MIGIKQVSTRTSFKNDAIFYYYFKNNKKFINIILSKIYNLDYDSIKEINVLNKKPYLDSVFNKYNVLYIQAKINEEFVYLIINNIDSGVNTNYLENYMLNVELTGKYEETFKNNIGIAHNIYFINNDRFPYKKCLCWKNKNTNEIINFDYKYIYNVSKIQEESDINFKKVLKLLKLGTKKKLYIEKSKLDEAIVLKEKRKNIILKSIKNKTIE